MSIRYNFPVRFQSLATLYCNNVNVTSLPRNLITKAFLHGATSLVLRAFGSLITRISSFEYALSASLYNSTVMASTNQFSSFSVAITSSLNTGETNVVSMNDYLKGLNFLKTLPPSSSSETPRRLHRKGKRGKKVSRLPTKYGHRLEIKKRKKESPSLLPSFL